LGNALLCSIACDLPPAGLGAIERSEQTSFEVATEAMSQLYQLMAQVAVST